MSADPKMPRQFLTYKYPIRPTKRQHRALEAFAEGQRILYNAALAERIGCYQRTGKGRSYIDQCKALTECRRDLPDMAVLPVNLQRWTLKRVDDAFTGFFGRMKRGRKAGFPRFRGYGRFDSFGFAEFRGVRFDGARIRFDGLPGALVVSMSRPLPLGADIRSCVFRREGRGWSICFQVAAAIPERREIVTAIGIDLGLKVFSYASDGVVIDNPRIARCHEREIRRRSRALARCKRGSIRRKKVKARLARTHRTIANCRKDFLHKQSAALVARADLIAAEDLRVANMVRNPTLARSISDAGWSKFLGMVEYKAANAGAHFVKIDPKNTSQRCSGCGVIVPKSLRMRVHSCPSCGLVLDRDENASRNILAAGIGCGQLKVAECRTLAAGNIDMASCI
jgi:putative transposase